MAVNYIPGINHLGQLSGGLAASTVRTSLALGSSDSPTFAGLTLSATHKINVGGGFQLYNVDDGANYERAFIKWTSNVLTFGMEYSGTGVARNVSVGRGNTTSGSIAFTAGLGNVASGIQSGAALLFNNATGDYSSAIGYGSTSSGARSTAVGRYNVASGGYASAMGHSNTASGSKSSAFGYGAITTIANTFEAGYWADATTRGGVVRTDSTGLVQFTVENSATPPADGGPTAGSEIVGNLGRGMWGLQRNGLDFTFYFNNAGTVARLSNLKLEDVEINGDVVTAANLPTSDPAVTGRLWNDSGTVKVSA